MIPIAPKQFKGRANSVGPGIARTMLARENWNQGETAMNRHGLSLAALTATFLAGSAALVFAQTSSTVGTGGSSAGGGTSSSTIGTGGSSAGGTGGSSAGGTGGTSSTVG